MTPTQKANYLFEVSRWKLMGFDSTDAMKDAVAKDMALFVVDEILETEPSDLNERIYWRVVEEQINKL